MRTDLSDVCRELKMAHFSNAEMIDMVLMYGQALGNSLGSKRLYYETFPECRLPSHKALLPFYRRLRVWVSLVILRNRDGYGFHIFIRCLPFESAREKMLKGV
ncbi:hypothetical protein Zmor_014518 [Zophobas morio]|uniref:DUF4817 domain-containing protein n=1 Tax=Zophobas morio TaxID=2755281 RepID=A0AA38MFP4_9CUCU|nr:hypothetical protein Zmor_014518 [Zophobas morio]